MQLGPLTTTSIGSFPRPSWLAETDRGHARFRLEGAALREAQDDATVLSLREQEELGLDIVTDGEQRRERFVYHAAADLGRHRHGQHGRPRPRSAAAPIIRRPCRASSVRSGGAWLPASRMCALPRRTPICR